MLPNFNKRNFERRENPRSPFGDIDPVIVKWRKNAMSAGSGSISANTMKALNTFYKTIKRAGIAKKMVTLNCYVPDNLIASITPLIHINNSAYTNVNFVSSDLNKDGLKGDGTSKYLKTEVNPFLVMPDNNSGGLTLYSNQALSENAYSIGCQDGGGTTTMILYYVFSNNATICDMFDPNVRLSFANTGFTGYISANRVSTSRSDLYLASSRLSHYSATNNTTSSSAVRPNFEAYVHVANTGGSVSAWSSRRYSFSAIHYGLTNMESSYFYHAIQALRNRLGGGYA
jgi:hypothetical protein